MTCMTTIETDLLLSNLPGLAYRCEALPPWRMHYVSPGVRELCGYEAEDLLTDRITWEGIMHPGDGIQVDAEVARAVAEDRPFDLIYRIITASGALKWVHEKGEAVRQPEGEERALVGFIMDVTVPDVTESGSAQPLVMNRAALIESMAAELLYLSRQSAMATMASTLAHELTQPLASITFYAAALKRMATRGDGESSASEIVQALEENALRAGEIIRRIRESTQIGAPRLERFSCNSIVREAVGFSTIGCEGVEFELDLCEDEIEYADRVQIQQVLVNLIRNACQAMRGRKDRRVTIRSWTVADPRPMLQVSISDNGPGVPAQLLPAIFREGVSTKDSGMGLGLSISRTIIEAHGGRIWAENDGGATFSFEIPIDGKL